MQPTAAVRQPVAADKYYPASALELRRQLDACLASPAPTVKGPLLQPPSLGASSGRRLAGLIVPHGSLQDSGHVAAAAYSLLASQLASSSHHRHARHGRSTAHATSAAACGTSPAGPAASSPPASPRPLSLFLLGTNHFTSLPLACLSSMAAWATPLASVPVDREVTAELAAEGLPVDDRPHSPEHSLENQLPFLQHALADTPFAIAPVCVGWLGSNAAAQALAGQVGGVLARKLAGSEQQQPGALLIATTDFTHAGPSYREPVAAPWMSLREHCLFRDSPALHAICQGDPAGFLAACEAAGTSLCGRWPTAVFMHVAKRLGWDLELISYAPSDLCVQTGDINGFAAFAAWAPA